MVIPQAYTIPSPGAMVIEACHAVVTVTAVLGSRRAIDVASRAVLDVDHLMTISLHYRGWYCNMFWVPGDNSWIG